MRTAKLALLYALGLSILVATGAIHGSLTGRWSRSSALENVAARLGSVPMSVGPWEGRNLPFDRRLQEQAGIAGYVVRRYEDGGGQAVTVMLVCGRPGPIAAHTPEVCYPGNGYEPSSPRFRLPVGAGSPPDEFWFSDFSKRDSALVKQLRVVYGWSTDGTWKASETPRFGFAGSPVLYKLYVIRELPKADESGRDDPTVDFLNRFLPEVRKNLFPGQGARGIGMSVS